MVSIASWRQSAGFRCVSPKPFSLTYDGDLLKLEKPFGVEIIRPAELIRRIG
jgi:hypothetical protein